MRLRFCKPDYVRYCAECGFTEDELRIFDLLQKGKSRVEIAFATNRSVRTVDRTIRTIKDRIIYLEQHYPN